MVTAPFYGMIGSVNNLFTFSSNLNESTRNLYFKMGIIFGRLKPFPYSMPAPKTPLATKDAIKGVFLEDSLLLAFIVLLVFKSLKIWEISFLLRILNSKPDKLTNLLVRYFRYWIEQK